MTKTDKPIQLVFTCKVCDKPFKDGWKHALKGKGLLTYKDKAHKKALSNVDYEQGSKCPLCDYDIHWYGSGENYEIVCSGCQFLFDED